MTPEPEMPLKRRYPTTPITPRVRLDGVCTVSHEQLNAAITKMTAKLAASRWVRIMHTTRNPPTQENP